MDISKLAASTLYPLAALSAVGIGFAIGGIFGQTVVAGIGVGLSTAITDRLLGSLRRRFGESKSGLLNHDIQRVLAKGFENALRQIEKDFFDSIEGRKLPRKKQQYIRDLFKAMRESEETFIKAIDTNVDEIRTYLYEDQETASQLLWSRYQLPLDTYPEGLQTFIQGRLLKEVTFFFGEELKKDNRQSNRAWRAFQRLMLESIRKSQLEILGNQKLIQEELQKLDGIAERLDQIQERVDQRLPADQEPLLKGLLAAVEQTGDDLEVLRSQVQATYELQQETHKKIESIASFLGIERRKTCFVTGPAERVQPLVDEIVAPVVQEFDYEVSLSQSRVEQGDLRLLEVADLVIADLTGSDFQVVYELTLSHCLGRPDITVIDPAGAYAKEDLPPDTLRIDLQQPEEGRRLLRQALQRVEQKASAVNPITSFFKAPLTEVSPAYGLALGYSRNMLWRAMPMFKALKEGAVGYVKVGSQWIRDPERLKRLRLRVLIPAELDEADKFNVKALYQREGWTEAALGFGDDPPVLSRLALLSHLEPDLVLADVPTTMSVMTDAIAARLGSDERNDTWRVHEWREISHFVRSLMRMMGRQEEGIRPLTDGLLEVVPLHQELDR